MFAILRRSMGRVRGTHLRVIAPGQHSLLSKNIAVVANRWTSEFPLQTRRRYRSTTHSRSAMPQKAIKKPSFKFLIHVISLIFAFK